MLNIYVVVCYLEDIEVRFYEEVDGTLQWQGFGEFQAEDVHKQVGYTNYFTCDNLILITSIGLVISRKDMCTLKQ